VWPRSADELQRVQLELAEARPPAWRPSGPRPAIAGVFVCFARGQHGRGRAGEPGWAGTALVRGDRRVVATVAVAGVAGAPYEPGLLALREGALLEAALLALPETPEVVIANATGRDHPRGAGLALHLGAELGLPSVGVTDRALLASGSEPGPERGAASALLIGGAEVARAVRTRPGARPVVVHPGWRTDLDTAVELVLGACRGRRAPEALRRARSAARSMRAHDAPRRVDEQGKHHEGGS
jgi:deoxyribonuclease V